MTRASLFCTDNSWIGVATCCLVLSLSMSTRADELFVQLPTWDNIQAFNYTNSMRNSDTGNYGWRTYDNFSFQNLSIVDGISFQGTYYDWQVPGNNPAAPNSLGFEFHFWEDNGGNFPSNYLGVEFVDINDIDVIFNSNWNNELDIYDFYTDLNPREFDPNQQYWISVVSRSIINEDNGVPAFGWMSGLATDGITITDNGTLQEWVPSGTFDTWQADRSLTLHGSVIPEPSTGLICLAGFLCLCGGVRSRTRTGSRKTSEH